MNGTNHINNSPSSATSRTTVLSNFGVYQQTSIGYSDISIRTLVPDTISTKPYRKALIVTLFFHQIMTLSDTPSISFSDLMSTVASYFGLNTGSTEREAETADINIRNDFFLFSNLQGVDFSDVSGRPLTIPDPACCPADLTYLLTFLFVLSLPLPQLISALPHHLYPLNFLSICLNHLALLPLVRL